MNYNNGFPVNYQQMFYPQTQQTPLQAPIQPQIQPQSAQGNNSSRIWVNGEIGAKSYLVAPNTTVDLWDSEQQTIYLKSADASGMPSIRILDYKFREAAQPKIPAENTAPAFNDYATKEDIKILEGKIDDLQAKIEAPVPKSSGRKKAADDDE